jgi:DNA ligase-1
MTEIIKILNQIKETSGRNDKEQILNDNKDNKLLKDVLKFVYNPFIVTGISTKKLNKKVMYTDRNREIYDIYDLMNYLQTNNSGRDSDIEQIQVYIDHIKYDEKEFIKELVTKSLKIGLTSNTLNKVFGKGFIPSFEVMLAQKYSEHEHKVTGDFIITTKLDGIRNVLIKQDGKITMFSRQGQPHLGFTEIYNEAMNLPDNIVLDGEFILNNDKGLNSADLYRETVKVARKDGEKKDVIFHVFDYMSFDEFTEGVSIDDCLKRKNKLSDLLNKHKFEFIKEVIPLYIGSDKDKVGEYLNKAIEEGHEGVMVNIANATYKCKRCSDILKVKKFNDADVRVIDVLEGSGKNLGKLGAITIEFLHEGNIYSCNCGSGFSDEERVEYFNNPELILGKIVTIGYFEISRNSSDELYSFRFPTWKGIIRDDKTEISMN